MHFTIPLKILAKPRPRFANGHAYLPKNYKEQRKEIKRIINEQDPEMMKGPLYVSILFYTTGKRIADIEQMAGSIKDALEGVCYYNDVQISESRTKHMKKGGEDRVTVIILKDHDVTSDHYKEVNYDKV
jgi:Holliday junction resolvase RusA-like endonuclease